MKFDIIIAWQIKKVSDKKSEQRLTFRQFKL